jgi:hypothetical protein
MVSMPNFNNLQDTRENASVGVVRLSRSNAIISMLPGQGTKKNGN